MRLSHKVAAAAVAAFLVTGLAACSDDQAAPETPPTQSEAPSEEPTEPEEPTVEPTETEEPAEEPAEEPSSGDAETQQAAWAKDITVSGDLLTTVDGGDFTVDIYQVAVQPSTKTGSWVDPDTNKPLIDEGTDLVFVNYVITNTSDKEIPLTHSLVAVEPRYDDWMWAQGMGSITDSAVDEKLGIQTSAIAPASGEAPFPWLPGEQFAYGTNFAYQAGSDINFKVRLTPALEDGNLNHDERVEFDGETTIK